ncbi:MAG: fibronectin type III domain-containing protein [Acidobacteriota bacterium]
MKTRTMSLALLAGCLCFALPLTLSATTFVMVSDQDLADQSAVIVEARVLSKDAAPVPGIPSTDYQIEIARVIKGDVPGSNLIVRTPGGVGPDGIGLELWGVPKMAEGDRMLFFLSPATDGTFRIKHLLLGAFRDIDWRGRRVLARHLSGAHELPLDDQDTARAENRGPRDREAFIEWLTDRGRGVERPVDYFVELLPTDVTAFEEHFTLFENEGRNLRWIAFDGGGTVRWRVNSSGQPGLTLQQTIDAFRGAMQAWTGDSQSFVRLAFGSSQTTTLNGGLTTFDSTNAITFSDPNGNDSFDAPFSCGSGGVLAIGGPWFSNQLDTFRGVQYQRIIGGDIITNAGLDCYFTRSGNPVLAAQELFGHELGHTLGFGHACGDDESPSCGSSAVLNDALMRAFVHNDGRGARLNNDDRAALGTLYSDGQTTGPTRPAAPTGLAAILTSATSASVTWTDNADNETSYRLEIKTGAGSFVEVGGSLPPNTDEVVVNNLAPLTTYSFRVRARNGGGFSPYSNEASLTTPPDTPSAPFGLEAVAQSPTAVRLTWNDSSVNETQFEIELRSPKSGYIPVGTIGPNTETFLVGNLVTGRPYTFRVRASNTSGSSDYSNEASATPLAGVTGCTNSADSLCLLDDRFRVQVDWRNQFAGGQDGSGRAQTPFTGDSTGVFTFFNDINVELIVKALDATSIDQGYWFFYGALSTVEYWITVVDTETQLSNTYYNPPGELCGFADTPAFPGDQVVGGNGGNLRAAPIPLPAPAVESVGAATGTCVANAETLCLFDDRFAVTVDWLNHRNLDEGTGKAVPGTRESGYFWFFGPENIELVLKVLDNRPSGNNFWIFYGALSDVVYDITVRDTVTGLETTYSNEAGNFCGNADTVGLPESVLTGGGRIAP